MCIQTIAQPAINNNTSAQSEIKKRDAYYKEFDWLWKITENIRQKNTRSTNAKWKATLHWKFHQKLQWKSQTKEFDSWTKDSKFQDYLKEKLNNIEKHSVKKKKLLVI
jgi:hypothetical protein